MLELLHIENIAIIEAADIEFAPGFNALTGETGAGKSIVIDSLSAVLGQRTSRELIRTGAEKAFVSAAFSGMAPELTEELGIQPEQYAIVGYSMGGHLTGLFGTESVGYQHYNVPKPAALLLGYPINDMTYIKPIYHVIQDIGAYGPKYYTRNLSDEITPDYPATYHWHGVNDTLLKELVSWRQGPQLEAALQANHVKHVYRVFNNAPHVCGIGTGTDAENWLVEATAFWEEQCA